MLHFLLFLRHIDQLIATEKKKKDVAVEVILFKHSCGFDILMVKLI